MGVFRLAWHRPCILPGAIEVRQSGRTIWRAQCLAVGAGLACPGSARLSVAMIPGASSGVLAESILGAAALKLKQVKPVRNPGLRKAGAGSRRGCRAGG